MQLLRWDLNDAPALTEAASRSFLFQTKIIFNTNIYKLPKMASEHWSSVGEPVMVR